MTASAGLVARLRARVGSFELDVELATGKGTLVVIGPNGAGKTTLLSLLLGVLPAERGRVTLEGRVLFDSELGIDLPVEQRRMGYLPQSYALFPHLDVEENILFALSSARRMSRRQLRVESRQLLARLGLADLAARGTETLSGGEKQRLALARAISVSPEVLLLDEPLAALDIPSRREVRALLSSHLREIGLPSIVVTHDAADARELGETILVLEGGRIIQAGSWEELQRAPASAFVREFVRPPEDDRSRAGGT